MIEIRRAIPSDLEETATLFDLYRQFYHQPADREGARKFIGERLKNEDSVIFLSLSGDATTGFVQLYPIFTSVGMKRSWLLNDLFVLKDFRNQGTARKLITHCKEHVRQTHAAGLLLETGKNNVEGNALYPSEDFILQDEVNFYFWQSDKR